jgi:hypothetical protein
MYGAVKKDFGLSKIGMNVEELQTYGYQRRPSHKDLSFVACTTSLAPSSSFAAIPQRTLGWKCFDKASIVALASSIAQ